MLLETRVRRYPGRAIATLRAGDVGTRRATTSSMPVPEIAIDDPDAIITRPMSKLAVLRADALACRQQLDEIADSLSPEFREAAAEFLAASARARLEARREEQR